MVRKTAVLIAVIILIFSSSPVISAPSYLNVNPVSGTTIDLSWTAVETENYDIWVTSDGLNWNKMFTTAVGVNRFTVSEGILPYHNYYFLVSAAGSVINPLTDANSTNSTQIGVGYPPNQHVHNYYLANTNLCANCHWTHRSEGPNLLKSPTVEETCLTCHDGTQSKYNVLEGMVSRDGSWVNPLASSAGPFGSMLGRTASAQPTSVHTIGTVLKDAPGGNLAGIEQWELKLSCVSCHAAHFSTNYRIIKSTTPENPDVLVKAFAESSFDSNKEEVNYISGINSLCSGCHPDYMAATGAGSLPAAGTYQSDGLFRHPVGISPASYGLGLTTSLPLEGVNRNNQDQISCITCHSAHGSMALSNSGKTGLNGSEKTNYLLRRDYYGVCQDCHKK